MGVVELDRDLVRQLVEVARAAQVAAQDVLQRRADEEVLLLAGAVPARPAGVVGYSTRVTFSDWFFASTARM